MSLPILADLGISLSKGSEREGFLSLTEGRGWQARLSENWTLAIGHWLRWIKSCWKPAQPKAKSQKPKAKSQKPKAKSQKPKAKSQKPKAKSQKPKAKSQKPKAKSQKPKAKSQKPKAKSQKPKAKSQKPKAKAKSQKPKAKSQKPKAKSQKPKAKSEKKRKMKIAVWKIFVLIILLGCQPDNEGDLELFEGELFFKLVDFGPEIFTTLGQDGRTLQEVLEKTPKSERTEHLLEVSELYEILKNEELLEKPYFTFAENKPETEIAKVFLDQREYEKISRFNLSDLRSRNEKVEIKFYGRRINEYMISCSKIESVNRVKGNQQWAK